MSDKEEEILALLKDIKASPAMNGAFDGLVKSVGEIKDSQNNMSLDLGIIKERQNEVRPKVFEMHEAIYNPDNGIYKRIGDLKNHANDHAESCDKLHDMHMRKDEEHDHVLQQYDTRIRIAESVDDDLQKIGGPRLRHLDSTVTLNKNSKKVFWALLVAAAGLIAKELWPWIITLF